MAKYCALALVLFFSPLYLPTLAIPIREFYNDAQTYPLTQIPTGSTVNSIQEPTFDICFEYGNGTQQFVSPFLQQSVICNQNRHTEVLSRDYSDCAKYSLCLAKRNEPIGCECGQGYKFSQETQSCRPSHEVTDCPLVISTQVSNGRHCDLDSSFGGTSNFLPNPVDCTQYSQCIQLASGDSLVIEYQCPGNQGFDPLTNLCRGNFCGVASPSFVSRRATSTWNEFQRHQINVPVSSIQRRVTIQQSTITSRTNERKFSSNSSGSYSSHIRSDDRNVRPQETEFRITNSTSYQNFAPVCLRPAEDMHEKCSYQGFFPIENDCKNYLICIPGKRNGLEAFVVSCPDDKLFSRIYRRCIPPRLNDCGSSNEEPGYNPPVHETMAEEILERYLAHYQISADTLSRILKKNQFPIGDWKNPEETSNPSFNSKPNVAPTSNPFPKPAHDLPPTLPVDEESLEKELVNGSSEEPTLVPESELFPSPSMEEISDQSDANLNRPETEPENADNSAESNNTSEQVSEIEFREDKKKVLPEENNFSDSIAEIQDNADPNNDVEIVAVNEPLPERISTLDPTFNQMADDTQDTNEDTAEFSSESQMPGFEEVVIADSDNSDLDSEMELVDESPPSHGNKTADILRYKMHESIVDDDETPPLSNEQNAVSTEQQTSQSEEPAVSVEVDEVSKNDLEVEVDEKFSKEKEELEVEVPVIEDSTEDAGLAPQLEISESNDLKGATITEEFPEDVGNLPEFEVPSEESEGIYSSDSDEGYPVTHAPDTISETEDKISYTDDMSQNAGVVADPEILSEELDQIDSPEIDEGHQVTTESDAISETEEVKISDNENRSGEQIASESEIPSGELGQRDSPEIDADQQVTQEADAVSKTKELKIPDRDHSPEDNKIPKSEVPSGEMDLVDSPESDDDLQITQEAGMLETEEVEIPDIDNSPEDKKIPKSEVPSGEMDLVDSPESDDDLQITQEAGITLETEEVEIPDIDNSPEDKTVPEFNVPSREMGEVDSPEIDDDIQIRQEAGAVLETEEVEIPDIHNSPEDRTIPESNVPSREMGEVDNPEIDDDLQITQEAGSVLETEEVEIPDIDNSPEDRTVPESNVPSREMGEVDSPEIDDDLQITQEAGAVLETDEVEIPDIDNSPEDRTVPESNVPSREMGEIVPDLQIHSREMVQSDSPEVEDDQKVNQETVVVSETEEVEIPDIDNSPEDGIVPALQIHSAEMVQTDSPEVEEDQKVNQETVVVSETEEVEIPDIDNSPADGIVPDLQIHSGEMVQTDSPEVEDQKVNQETIVVSETEEVEIPDLDNSPEDGIFPEPEIPKGEFEPLDNPEINEGKKVSQERGYAPETEEVSESKLASGEMVQTDSPEVEEDQKVNQETVVVSETEEVEIPDIDNSPEDGIVPDLQIHSGEMAQTDSPEVEEDQKVNQETVVVSETEEVEIPDIDNSPADGIVPDLQIHNGEIVQTDSPEVEDQKVNQETIVVSETEEVEIPDIDNSPEDGIFPEPEIPKREFEPLDNPEINEGKKVSQERGYAPETEEVSESKLASGEMIQIDSPEIEDQTATQETATVSETEEVESLGIDSPEMPIEEIEQIDSPEINKSQEASQETGAVADTVEIVVPTINNRPAEAEIVVEPDIPSEEIEPIYGPESNEGYQVTQEPDVVSDSETKELEISNIRNHPAEDEIGPESEENIREMVQIDSPEDEEIPDIENLPVDETASEPKFLSSEVLQIHSPEVDEGHQVTQEPEPIFEMVEVEVPKIENRPGEEGIVSEYEVSGVEMAQITSEPEVPSAEMLQIDSPEIDESQGFSQETAAMIKSEEVNIPDIRNSQEDEIVPKSKVASEESVQTDSVEIDDQTATQRTAAVSKTEEVEILVIDNSPEILNEEIEQIDSPEINDGQAASQGTGAAAETEELVVPSINNRPAEAEIVSELEIPSGEIEHIYSSERKEGYQVTKEPDAVSETEVEIPHVENLSEDEIIPESNVPSGEMVQVDSPEIDDDDQVIQKPDADLENVKVKISDIDNRSDEIETVPESEATSPEIMEVVSPYIDTADQVTQKPQTGMETAEDDVPDIDNSSSDAETGAKFHDTRAGNNEAYGRDIAELYNYNVTDEPDIISETEEIEIFNDKESVADTEIASEPETDEADQQVFSPVIEETQKQIDDPDFVSLTEESETPHIEDPILFESVRPETAIKEVYIPDKNGSEALSQEELIPEFVEITTSEKTQFPEEFDEVSEFTEPELPEPEEVSAEPVLGVQDLSMESYEVSNWKNQTISKTQLSKNSTSLEKFNPDEVDYPDDELNSPVQRVQNKTQDRSAPKSRQPVPYKYVNASPGFYHPAEIQQPDE